MVNVFARAMKSVLVTGGAGYIGSHAVRHLAQTGYRVITLDDLSEGHREAVLKGDFVAGDLANEALLESLFASYRFDGVMHFASRCYVAESMENPQRYYDQNLGSALTLFRVMLRHGVKKLILSSTCSIYGNPKHVPINENHPQSPINPYGETKYFLETILHQYDRAYGLRFVSLRYFNAAGASLDGQLGESHQPETHLIPRVLQVGKRQVGKVQIYGERYPTLDGSCVRDFIHVKDLVSAHRAAYEWLCRGESSEVFNLGTGHGYSVKQVVGLARQMTGRKIKTEIIAGRPGDPAELVADARKAKRLLKWTPRYSDLATIVETAWRWEQARRY